MFKPQLWFANFDLSGVELRCAPSHTRLGRWRTPPPPHSGQRGHVHRLAVLVRVQRAISRPLCVAIAQDVVLYALASARCAAARPAAHSAGGRGDTLSKPPWGLRPLCRSASAPAATSPGSQSPPSEPKLILDQGRNVPGCTDPAQADSRRAALSSAATAAARLWEDRAHVRDWTSVAADLSVYRFCGETLTADPRRTQAYKDAVLDALGLVDTTTVQARYGHLSPPDLAALREVTGRCAAAFWVEGTPRTTVRFMAHDTIPTGPPVRTPPHRLSTTDAAWIEDQILQEVRRGQLERGISEWGSPPFPTKAVVPAHQRARKRRMVVDYRRVNARTRRALYYVRRADDVKQECAGSLWFSFLDACAGFNQIANTDRARRMLAILSRSGPVFAQGASRSARTTGPRISPMPWIGFSHLPPPLSGATAVSGKRMPTTLRYALAAT